MIRHLSMLASLFVLAAPWPASAQTAAPPHLSQVDGQATVSRTTGALTAVPDLPILAGDRIETTAGRVELLFGSGSVMHLDSGTTIDVNAGTVVRLLGGRLVVAGTPDQDRLQVDAAPASVRFETEGEVRLSLEGAPGASLLDVAVVRGTVAVIADAGVVEVQAGERVQVGEGEAPSLPVAFNSARGDDFYRWSDALLASRLGTTSASYLPADLASYGGAFDEYGTWAYQAPYGYVWYPTVAAGWCPYRQGHWSNVPGLGWNFVGRDPWSWPTHHYGRWGLTPAGVWFWIPSAGWSSAWVQWAVAPNYVGWCPLGWDNRPVGRFYVDARHDGHGGGHGRGWSVVSTSAFTRQRDIRAAAVETGTSPRSGAPAFAFQRTPPNVGVPRGTVSVAPARASEPRGPVVQHVRRGEPAGPRLEPGAEASRATGGTFAGRDRGAGDVRRTPVPEAPPVIYYRGTSIPPEAQRGGDAYRHGGAIIRGSQPGDVNTIGAPADTGVNRSMPPPGSVPVPRVGAPGLAPRSGGSFPSPAPHGQPSNAPIVRGPGHVAPPPPPPAPAPHATPNPAPQGSGQGVGAPRGGNPHR